MERTRCGRAACGVRAYRTATASGPCATLVVEAGGGLLLTNADCTSEWVAARSRHCSPTRNAEIGDALAGVARTDAAAVLAKRTLEVIG